VANNRATEEEKTWRARRSLRPTDPEGAAPGEKGLFTAGVLPFLGGLLLTDIFIKALIDYNKVENTYAGKFLGFGSQLPSGSASSRARSGVRRR
jgi:hypothetical protein